MPERCRDFLFGEPGTVVTFYQQGNPAAVVDVASPAQGFIEQAELLVEPALLLDRGDSFGARRAAINSVRLAICSLAKTAKPPICISEAPQSLS